MRIVTWILVGFLLASLGVNKYLYNQNQALTGKIVTIQFTSDQAVQNAKNIQWNNQVQVETTAKELANSQTAWARKLDSLTKANNIRVRNLESALIVSSHWVDTTKIKATTEAPKVISAPAELVTKYSIPVSDNTSDCWGFKGEILTTDPGATLNILSRTTNNSVQLIVQKERRFLFWVTRKPKYNVFNDCGEPLPVNIQFK